MDITKDWSMIAEKGRAGWKRGVGHFFLCIKRGEAKNFYLWKTFTLLPFPAKKTWPPFQPAPSSPVINKQFFISFKLNLLSVNSLKRYKMLKSVILLKTTLWFLIAVMSCSNLQYPITSHIGAAPVSESNAILKKIWWKKLMVNKHMRL